MSKDASGQVDPKKTNSEKRVKRGRLHFTEEEVTRQAGEQASGQVDPKKRYFSCWAAFFSGLATSFC